MVKKIKIYVAGPMTGLPELNFPAFFDAAARLEAVGYEVINPARRGPEDGKGWADYMRDGIRDVLEADAVALLPGWTNSRGASLEAVIAHDLGLPIHELGSWILMAEGKALP